MVKNKPLGSIFQAFSQSSIPTIQLNLHGNITNITTSLNLRTSTTKVLFGYGSTSAKYRKCTTKDPY
jgi:hypothetical protein